MALTEIGADADDELIGAAEHSSPGLGNDPELPPLRLRGSVAARIVALVVLVVLGTGAAALIIRAQVQGLRADFDLLTGVYVPFQTRMLRAQNHSQSLSPYFTSFGNPEDQLERAELLNLEEALELRAALVSEVRAPLLQALSHPRRIGGLDRLDSVRELDAQLQELESLVTVEGLEVTEVLGDRRREQDINRRFTELGVRANEAVRYQRDRVAEAGRQAERRALIITIAAALFSLIATLLVILTLRPLRRLAVSVRRIGRGDWSERIEVGPKPARDDEVARLGREVNLMAAALEERERRVLRGERLAAIGRLAAQITHEIRNPLSSVALNAELLGDELDTLSVQADDSQEARQLLTRITSEVDRLTQITEAYLGFARRPKPNMAKVDLAYEVGDLLDFLAQEHGRNRVEVVRELPAAPIWVEADSGQLRQALLNLLRNAQEAVLEVAEPALVSEADGVGDLLDEFEDLAQGNAEIGAKAVGSITVSLAEDEGFAAVAIADTGPGIPSVDPADGPKTANTDGIFEAFVTSKAHGTGLGLPMVQQIALDHGGAVRLLATGPSGTTFELRLPACDPPGASVSSESLA